jgi:hypothetical protein
MRSLLLIAEPKQAGCAARWQHSVGDACRVSHCCCCLQQLVQLMCLNTDSADTASHPAARFLLVGCSRTAALAQVCSRRMAASRAVSMQRSSHTEQYASPASSDILACLCQVASSNTLVPHCFAGQVQRLLWAACCVVQQRWRWCSLLPAAESWALLWQWWS